VAFFNSVFGLLIALGILVTIHEYGHFWVARRCGVKVLRFSIGFGKPIFTRVDQYGTEFSVAWIPLGGYVKMLDEREGDVPEEELDQAFTRKAPIQKIAIALAGPVANVIFAILAFSLMYMIGVRDLVPLIDQPAEGTPAAEAQLQRGDLIRKVDGKDVMTYTDLNLAVASRVGDTGMVQLEVARGFQTLNVELPIDSWLRSEQTPNPLQALGLSPKLPESPAHIGRIEPGGAAERDGLLVGDVITEADGIEISGWLDWVDVIQANANQPVALTVLRDGQEIQLTITPGSVDRDGQSYGYVGAAMASVTWADDQLITSRYWPIEAVSRGFQDTFDMVTLSYQMLWKMVTGKVSLRQIGGPISMAQMAGVSVTSGIEVFIGFLAFISISLAIVNLLPVPVLDGGHVVMHSIELIFRRELPERVQMVGMQIGMAFIIALMLVAFFNDFTRIM
jgi:regulator of sigma E protease